MLIEINAPPVRSLNANEKQVYQMLANGITDVEISKLLQIPYNTAYFSGIPELSIVSIITSIREKGWEIPKKNRNNRNEEIIMPIGKKTPIETVNAIKRLLDEGKSLYEIYKSLHLPPTTARNIIDRLKKEKPAPAETDTSANKEQNIPNYIITPAVENVKSGITPNYLISEILDKELHKRAFELGEILESIKEKQFEVDTLQEEYDFCLAEYDAIYGEFEKVKQ